MVTLERARSRLRWGLVRFACIEVCSLSNPTWWLLWSVSLANGVMMGRAAYLYWTAPRQCS